MPSRYQLGFQPVAGTTGPSFNSTLGSSGVYAIASTTAPLRTWEGPTSRVVRIASIAADDFFVNFGTASTTTVAASSNSILILGGTVEIITLEPSHTHVAVQSSTSVVVNFTPGYGR